MSINNLPLPYHDELLFSVMARAKVHLNFQSPKTLLKTVYGHSGLRASIRFGSNLCSLANSYNYPSLSPQALLYEHTLWPLLAPFIPYERKEYCEAMLLGQRDKSVTVSSGIAASRVLYSKHLRYCPLCIQEQYGSTGETYWQRLPQVPGISLCVKHMCSLAVHKRAASRINQHEYFAPVLSKEFVISPLTLEPFLCGLNEFVVTLLTLRHIQNPTFAQWSAYYQALATSTGCNRGKCIKHEKIHSMVTQKFPKKWLKSVGLVVNSEESNWTRGIFRKHRKSFSFLEHYIINSSLLTSPWDVKETLNAVSRYNTVRCLKPSRLINTHTTDLLESYRESWVSLLKVKGAKQSRVTAGAAYAWLYRHDRAWLLSMNSNYRNSSNPKKAKVDWNARDKSYARKLVKVIDNAEADIYAPQHTKSWLLTHFPNKPSIEKWLPKLPITNSLLIKYAETTSEYQIRRITRNLMFGEYSKVKRLWYLMRVSGLNKYRLTQTT
ncbi:MAG: TniQ family protein [Alteromonas stellipolaris]|uniref:TnsD family Tn7-like transposition protein n=1 Tax=Alteromonas stellipolaris TaxID=233316 RepID=UPI003B8B5A56